MLPHSNRYRFSRFPQTRRASFRSTNDHSEIPMLNIAVDSQSLFRNSARRLLPRGEKPISDEVLDAQLSEANREFASLLQEVSAVPKEALAGSTSTNQSINDLLMRAVRCATKQYMLQAELGNLALTDELTGLYNRRGFMTIAERQLKVARRSGRSMLLFFVDVDHLKRINDSFGHFEGDAAIKRTARALEATFRDCDVIARLGGDEFAVLAIEASSQSEATIRARLCKHLKSSAPEESQYSISLSLGVARFNVRSGASIGELMTQADQAMYEQKRHRPACAGPFGHE
jgi:diguanylate cyclase (GGDEF)-like protein